MRALNVPAAGSQPQLSEVPMPEVAEGTVLIRVKAAGLNALDNALAAGMMAAMLPHEYPLVLGRDAAGVVEAVGAGVDHLRVGDAVLGHVLLAPPIKAGTIAESGVDALIELAAYSPDAAPLAAVRKGGRVAATTMAANEEALAEYGLTGGGVMAGPVREVTGSLAEQAATGALKIDVTTVLPFEQAADGLATIASGQARGKIVVKISD